MFSISGMTLGAGARFAADKMFGTIGVCGMTITARLGHYGDFAQHNLVDVAHFADAAPVGGGFTRGADEQRFATRAVGHMAGATSHAPITTHPATPLANRLRPLRVQPLCKVAAVVPGVTAGAGAAQVIGGAKPLFGSRRVSMGAVAASAFEPTPLEERKPLVHCAGQRDAGRVLATPEKPGAAVHHRSVVTGPADEFLGGFAAQYRPFALLQVGVGVTVAAGMAEDTVELFCNTRRTGHGRDEQRNKQRQRR